MENKFAAEESFKDKRKKKENLKKVEEGGLGGLADFFKKFTLVAEALGPQGAF